MAVRHGYGKVAGTDALIFAYDTGDTRNSYKGEPTTNLASLDLSNAKWISEGGTKLLQSETLDGYPVYQFRSSGSLIYISPIAFNQLAATTNDVTMAASFKNIGTSAATVSVYLARDFSTDSNGVSNNRTIPADGRWYRHSWTSYAAANLANYVEFRTFSDTLLISKPQVEYKRYATQPVEGTRSATQGLLDLTGNNTIDLANVSFDSNAQMEFDGTDDYIDLGSDQVIKTSGGWTVESVVYYDAVAGGYNNVTSPANFIGSDSIAYSSWYWSVLSNKLALWNISPGIWKYGSTTLQPNTWYHAVLVSYDNGTQYQMYLNGAAEGGDHTTYSWNASYSGLRVRYIGRGNSANVRVVNGKIPVTKIYNRALTADEVRNNYSHYKTRFNI